MPELLESLVTRARQGDRAALEDLIGRIQTPVYGLALRMLYNPAEAEDAAQEILLKIVTHLGSFRAESAFTTWMYRVAANHLLTIRKRRAEQQALSFDEYEQDLAVDPTVSAAEPADSALEQLYVDEIRISCLQGLLLCLDRPHRLAFLLVDVFDVTGDEGAAILGITPAAFRRRLSRARARLKDFLARNCSVVRDGNPCRCEHHVAAMRHSGRFDGPNLVFAAHPARRRQVDAATEPVREMDELNRLGGLFRCNPEVTAPPVFIERIRDLLHSDNYRFFSQE